ncbi:hypothetical protein ACFQYP_00015 [Nonomuraea antimicrobica]
MATVTALNRPSRPCPAMIIALQPRVAIATKSDDVSSGTSANGRSAAARTPVRPSPRAMIRNRADTPPAKARTSRTMVAAHTAQLAAYSATSDTSSRNSQSSKSPATSA